MHDTGGGQEYRLACGVHYVVKELGLWCLMTPGLSKDICVKYEHNFSKLANHQTRHQATHIVGCQPGDCLSKRSKCLF